MKSAVSILIPIVGSKTIHETLDSVICQDLSDCEVLILRNGIKDLPENTELVEKETYYRNTLIREIYIRTIRKGNALNIGIQHASHDLICVLDADCILKEDALSYAVSHFENDEVVAVGERLLVKQEDYSALERIQFYEYAKTFQLSRKIFARLNAQCLISGAFGMFRKAALLEVNGYDTDTVGEDMELVLRLQDNHGKRSAHRTVYDSDAVCFTGVPYNLKRLLHQRDRWQRGLLDCFMKHHNMIANPLFGFLGLLTMIYQLIVGLLGPVFWCIYVALLILEEAIPLCSMVFFGYYLLQILLTIFVAAKDTTGELIRILPRLIITTLEAMLLQIPIIIARMIGMITFYWRRLVW